ncbi:hypothetical protein AKJ16_DCAP04441 [Drosera capensis]
MITTFFLAVEVFETGVLGDLGQHFRTRLGVRKVQDSNSGSALNIAPSGWIWSGITDSTLDGEVTEWMKFEKVKVDRIA